jgi:tRNA U34 2-thiouridine synthase MnmA/TrmU
VFVTFSGGLDSMISAKILEEEGVKLRLFVLRVSFFLQSKQKNQSRIRSKIKSRGY